MEATGEELTLLHKILPPRLEDAGLENCALPPHSIQEAFLKAASAVGCISAGVDPAIDDSPPSDVLVGVKPETGPAGPCATVKGGDWVEGGGGGDVVFGGQGIEDEIEKKGDVVVIGESCGGGEGSGDCVGGAKGKLKERENNHDDDDDDKKKPTLVEGFFFNP